MLTVKFVKFTDLARVPVYAHEGDSGADLYAANVGQGPLWPGETRVVWCDIGIELPEGYEAQIRPRSGLSSKGVLVHLGTIDQPYRGNIGVTLTNVGSEAYPVKVGDRVAQLVIAPVMRAQFELVEALAASSRATGGFGSTGR